MKIREIFSIKFTRVLLILLCFVLMLAGTMLNSYGEDATVLKDTRGLKFTNLGRENKAYTIAYVYHDIWRDGYDSNNAIIDEEDDDNPEYWSNAPGSTQNILAEYTFKFGDETIKSVKVSKFQQIDEHEQIWEQTRGTSPPYSNFATFKSATTKNLTGIGTDTVNFTLNVTGALTGGYGGLGYTTMTQPDSKDPTKTVYGRRYYIPVVVEVEFEPKEQQIEVNYVSDEGKELAPSYTEKAELGATYSSLDFEGYEYQGYDFSVGEITEKRVTAPSKVLDQAEIDTKKQLVITFVYKDTDDTIIEPIGDDVLEGEDLDNQAEIVIKAENKGYEKFDVTKGIPSSEYLYVQANLKDYLYKYKFSRVRSSKIYPVLVKKTYIQSYDIEDEEWVSDDSEEGGYWESVTITKTRTISVSQTINVERKYSYWEENELSIFNLEKVEVENYALPNGICVLINKNPKFGIIKDVADKRIIEPTYNPVIDLGSEDIGYGDAPSEDFTSYAEDEVGQIKVTNDYLIFTNEDGTVVEPITSIEYYEVNAPTPNVSVIENNKIIELIERDLLIQPKKLNGIYESTAHIVYEDYTRGSIVDNLE